jgi:peroxiredoxin
LGDLAAVHAELAAQGVGLAAISVDDPADSRALAEKLSLPFPLLSDPEARVIAAYGVQMKGPSDAAGVRSGTGRQSSQTMAVPATFVVRPDRTIAWRYVGDAVPDRPPLDVVEREVERLR